MQSLPLLSLLLLNSCASLFGAIEQAEDLGRKANTFLDYVVYLDGPLILLIILAPRVRRFLQRNGKKKKSA